MGGRQPTRASDLVLVLASAVLLAAGVVAFALLDPVPKLGEALLRTSAERQADDLLRWGPWALMGLGGSGVVLGLKGLLTGR